MSSQSDVKEVFTAIHDGWFIDGSPTIEEEFAKVIVPGEDYSKLLAEELPRLDLLGQAIVVLAFAMAKHIEALPYAVTLLDAPDGPTRFDAALAAALLNDSRGVASIRQQITQSDPEMYSGHIIEGLEDAVSRNPSAELQELLREAKAAFGYT